MAMLILHLSDIHISGASNPILTRADRIASALNPHLPNLSQVVIVVSGDIADTGDSKEYALAEKLFVDLADAIRSEARCPISYLFVPGNHDCNFRLNNAARDNNIGLLKKALETLMSLLLMLAR